MFTGIVEEVGTVAEVKRGSGSSFIRIKAEKVLSDANLGDSIAVNGVCLTVTEIANGAFCADVMNETLNRSSLGSLTRGSHVNLERAMSAQGRFGGHIVSGHIDSTGTVTNIRNDGIAVWYTVSTGSDVLRYIVEKGSIAIDGISLTVAKVSDSGFDVSIIPHTAEETILSEKRVGDTVNLENDIIAKYVEKLMRPAAAEKKSSGVTLDFLAEHGF